MDPHSSVRKHPRWGSKSRPNKKKRPIEGMEPTLQKMHPKRGWNTHTLKIAPQEGIEPAHFGGKRNTPIWDRNHTLRLFNFFLHIAASFLQWNGQKPKMRYHQSTKSDAKPKIGIDKCYKNVPYEAQMACTKCERSAILTDCFGAPLLKLRLYWSLCTLHSSWWEPWSYLRSVSHKYGLCCNL